MPVGQFLISIIAGAALGTIIAWAPYASAGCSVLAALTVLYALRTLFSPSFRRDVMCPAQFNVIFFAWIAILIFLARPTGLQTHIPPMTVENERVGDLIKKWEKLAPNVEIVCDEAIKNRRISINTITPITALEAIEIIEYRIGASHKYKIYDRGRSIARGSHIVVTVKFDPKRFQMRFMENNYPYIYDGLQ